MAETWRQVWGDGKLFSGPRFLNDVFSEKMSIFKAKISDDLFLVILGFFLSFPRFFVSFTMFNVVYDHFLTRTTTVSEKNSFMTPFLKTLFVLSRESDNTTSQNIGGRMHGPSPTSNFFWGPPPNPPRSPLLAHFITNSLTCRAYIVQCVMGKGSVMAVIFNPRPTARIQPAGWFQVAR